MNVFHKLISLTTSCGPSLVLWPFVRDAMLPRLSILRPCRNLDCTLLNSVFSLFIEENINSHSLVLVRIQGSQEKERERERDYCYCPWLQFVMIKVNRASGIIGLYHSDGITSVLRDPNVRIPRTVQNHGQREQRNIYGTNLLAAAHMEDREGL
jgi:hypothetical protein